MPHHRWCQSARFYQHHVGQMKTVPVSLRAQSRPSQLYMLQHIAISHSQCVKPHWHHLRARAVQTDLRFLQFLMKCVRSLQPHISASRLVLPVRRVPHSGGDHEISGARDGAAPFSVTEIPTNANRDPRRQPHRPTATRAQEDKAPSAVAYQSTPAFRHLSLVPVNRTSLQAEQAQTFSHLPD